MPPPAASEQDPSKLLAQLALEDAIALLTQSLGVRGGHVPGVLERCPALLGRQPPPESLEAFQVRCAPRCCCLQPPLWLRTLVRHAICRRV